MLDLKKTLTNVLLRIGHVAGTLSPASGAGLSSASFCRYFYDKGTKTVRIIFSFATSTTVSTSTVLYDALPAAYRPSSNWGGILVANVGGNAGMGMCQVSATGEITQRLSNSCTQGVGYIEYPISGGGN